jgi:hypothetical protein
MFLLLKKWDFYAPFLQSAFASAKQLCLVTCFTSHTRLFFCWDAITSLALILPMISCACRQVKKSCSIDERSVPSQPTCVRYSRIANERMDVSYHTHRYLSTLSVFFVTECYAIIIQKFLLQSPQIPQVGRSTSCWGH